MIETFKSLAGTITVCCGVATGAYKLGDVTGYRFAWKWELDQQGFFNRRLQLLDKQRAGTIQPIELGELCGLSHALHLPAKDCWGG